MQRTFEYILKPLKVRSYPADISGGDTSQLQLRYVGRRKDCPYSLLFIPADDAVPVYPAPVESPMTQSNAFTRSMDAILEGRIAGGATISSNRARHENSESPRMVRVHVQFSGKVRQMLTRAHQTMKKAIRWLLRVFDDDIGCPRCSRGLRK